MRKKPDLWLPEVGDWEEEEELEKDSQNEQTSSYKMKTSWGCNVQRDDCS